jgi:hypothetical protein
MLTTLFYTAAASGLAGGPATAWGFAIAVGEGTAAWDAVAPAPDRTTAQLTRETARRAVPPEALVFLDASGRPSRQPTPRLRFAVTFPPGEGTGTLRECGLFARRADRDVLLSYHTHPRIEKEAGGSLQRTISIDLTPRPVAPGSRLTRFLGNTYSTEIHDLDRETPNCQIPEIRFDRRFYFAGLEQARAAGYDPCAYCFGRDLSER